MSDPSTRPIVVLCGDTRRTAVQEAMSHFARRSVEHCLCRDVELADLSPRVVEGTRLLVVFGGDGSMLMAARRLEGNPIPMVGVNVGKFGFLAPFNLDELIDDLPGLMSDPIPTRNRMMLNCTVRRADSVVLEILSLNDIVISGGLPSRLHWIGLWVDDEKAVTYRGDGLIVSTPVGSTAYSLAAGGPLLCPGMEAVIVAPICPHTMADRALVVPADSTLTLRVKEPGKGVGLTIDGQESIPLNTEDVITVEKNPAPLVVVPSTHRTFFETLREKFYWGGHPNYGD